MDAPEWVRMLPTGKPVVFRASAAAVAEILERTTPWKDVLAVSTFRSLSRFVGVRSNSAGAGAAGVRARADVPALRPSFTGFNYSLCWGRWVR